MQERALDSEARSMTRRRSYMVKKSRHPQSLDNLGGYCILDPSTNISVASFNFSFNAQRVFAGLLNDPNCERTITMPASINSLCSGE